MFFLPYIRFSSWRQVWQLIIQYLAKGQVFILQILSELPSHYSKLMQVWSSFLASGSLAQLLVFLVSNRVSSWKLQLPPWKTRWDFRFASNDCQVKELYERSEVQFPVCLQNVSTKHCYRVLYFCYLCSMLAYIFADFCYAGSDCYALDIVFSTIFLRYEHWPPSNTILIDILHVRTCVWQK